MREGEVDRPTDAEWPGISFLKYALEYFCNERLDDFANRTHLRPGSVDIFDLLQRAAVVSLKSRDWIDDRTTKGDLVNHDVESETGRGVSSSARKRRSSTTRIGNCRANV